VTDAVCVFWQWWHAVDDVDTSPVCAFPWAGPIWYDHATLTQLWDAMVDTYIKVGHILNAAGKVPIISSTNYFSDFEGGTRTTFLHCHFILTPNIFAKIGSGQTYKELKERRFCLQEL
jgi:hypothetical protein